VASVSHIVDCWAVASPCQNPPTIVQLLPCADAAPPGHAPMPGGSTRRSPCRGSGSGCCRTSPRSPSRSSSRARAQRRTASAAARAAATVSGSVTTWVPAPSEESALPRGTPVPARPVRTEDRVLGAEVHGRRAGGGEPGHVAGPDAAAGHYLDAGAAAAIPAITAAPSTGGAAPPEVSTRVRPSDGSSAAVATGSAAWSTARCRVVSTGVPPSPQRCGRRHRVGASRPGQARRPASVRRRRRRARPRG